MAFSKTLSQVLVLYTKKVTENTHPAYATLDDLQELFPFNSPYPLRGNRSVVMFLAICFVSFFAKIQGVKRTLSHVYLPAKFEELSYN